MPACSSSEGGIGAIDFEREDSILLMPTIFWDRLLIRHGWPGSRQRCLDVGMLGAEQLHRRDRSGEVGKSSIRSRNSKGSGTRLGLLSLYEVRCHDLPVPRLNYSPSSKT